MPIFTRRLLDAAFELREHLESAYHRSGRKRLERLELADGALDKVYTFLRLDKDHASVGVSPTAGDMPSDHRGGSFDNTSWKDFPSWASASSPKKDGSGGQKRYTIKGNCVPCVADILRVKCPSSR